jgi:hypothetical protein
MHTKLKSSALVLGLALAMGAPAFATNGHYHSGPAPVQSHNQWRPCGAAPEVDPSLGFAGISFLTGSLAVLRSRLRK